MTIEIDHMSLSVSDYDKSKKFYVAALRPLRGGVVMEFPMDGGATAGLGPDGKPFLWISGGSGLIQHVHLALRAENRAQVDAFYAAAIAAGGRDNGPPGLRPHYHKNYYAAFVLDPDGHNIEVVTHAPPATRRASSAKAAGKRASAGKKPAKRATAKPARKTTTRKAAGKPATRRPAARKTVRKTAGKKTRR